MPANPIIHKKLSFRRSRINTKRTPTLIPILNAIFSLRFNFHPKFRNSFSAKSSHVSSENSFSTIVIKQSLKKNSVIIVMTCKTKITNRNTELLINTNSIKHMGISHE